MRKIQLRVWDNEEKIMIYSGEDYPFFELGGMYLEEILEEYNSGTGRFEVMQSTGLRDRDGEMIWEGDVVKFCHWTDCDTNLKREWEIGRIVWDDFAHRLTLHPEQPMNSLYESKNYKVIGNIYEDPELGGQSVDGDISVSKTEEVGSSPSAPAKKKGDIFMKYGETPDGYFLLFRNLEYGKEFKVENDIGENTFIPIENLEWLISREGISEAAAKSLKERGCKLEKESEEEGFRRGCIETCDLYFDGSGKEGFLKFWKKKQERELEIIKQLN